jgi:hypothetical protein
MAVADSLNSVPATNACAACALLAAAAVTRRLRKRRLRACAIAARTLLIIVRFLRFLRSFYINSIHAPYHRRTQKDLLIDYLVDNRIPIDARTNPWRTINNNIYANFIDEVRR